MVPDKLLDYIISLTHLYGLVHKDKVVEIFNLQNKKNIDAKTVDDLMNYPPEDLFRNFVEVYGDYFVHETIMEFDDFDVQLKQRIGKPFYIPNQEELLKYKDDGYFEINKEYQDLLEYITNNLLGGDEGQAEFIAEDIQGFCHQGFSPGLIFDLFNNRNVSFKDVHQVNEVMQLVMNLANNTRIWENNGHTPSEIFEKFEKSHLRPLPDKPFKFNGAEIIDFKTRKKIGRNDPCPCGSGKKYKRCCLLGQDETN